jgi:hypothetical protein
MYDTKSRRKEIQQMDLKNAQLLPAEQIAHSFENHRREK